MSSVQGCGRLDDVVAELALGLLDGAERSEALAHAEHCAPCQSEVAQLTDVGEQLLLLTPEIPPPLGFESRVVSRLFEGSSGHSTGKPSKKRGRRLFAAAAMALVATMAAVGIGLWRSGDDSAVMTSSMRSPSGADVGEATLHPRSPGELEIDVSGWVDELVAHDQWPETHWWLSVEDVDGGYSRYKISLADSPSRVSLADAVAESQPVLPEKVAIVSILDDEGNVWCSGEFRDLK